MKSLHPFVMIPKWVFTSGMFTEWTDTERGVYFALVFHVNLERVCYPSLRRLSMMVRKSRRSVQYAIEELWKCGALSVRRIGFNRTNCYYLPLDPAKCATNLHAYLNRKSKNWKRAKGATKLHVGGARAIAHRTRFTREQEKSKSSAQPVQNIIQNIIRLPDGSSLSTDSVR